MSKELTVIQTTSGEDILTKDSKLSLMMKINNCSSKNYIMIEIEQYHPEKEWTEIIPLNINTIQRIRKQ